MLAAAKAIVPLPAASPSARSVTLPVPAVLTISAFMKIFFDAASVRLLLAVQEIVALVSTYKSPPVPVVATVTSAPPVLRILLSV